MGFEGLIGNEKTKELLSGLLEADRFPHALILEGEEGIGKKTLAWEIALALMCSSGGAERPCRECAQCKKVLKKIHPDILTYTPSNKSGTISVDDIRSLIKDAYIKPNEAEYKILIVEECKNMRQEAQNALLKILEEPPEYAIIILCAETKASFLETVLSRSVAITLRGVSSAEGAEYICSQNSEIDYNDALSALDVAGGNIGKALQTLGDGRLKKIIEIANSIALASIHGNEYELIKACSVFERDNKTLIAAVTFLKTIFRDALISGSGVDLISKQKDTVDTLSHNLTKSKLLKMIDVCDNMIRFAKGNGNNALLITKLCYELRRAQGR